MKKVLFYTDTPWIGGAEQQMFLLAKFLPKEKYEVTLACSSYPKLNGWCQHFMENDFNVMRFKVFHKHDPRHFFYLKQILPRFDLLHLHVWNPASCRYGFLASGTTPLVITEHDPFRLRGLRGWLKQKFLDKPRAIIVASKAAAALVEHQKPNVASRVRVVHNGIDVDAWRESIRELSRAEYRRNEYEAQGNEKIILCVAELNDRKGQKNLIAAMHKVLEKIPKAKLVLVGEGPDESEYKKYARSLGVPVLFLGRRKDVSKLMASADLFVLPSIREAFGLVLLEAGAAGLPVIASDVGGIPEIIIDKVTGRLVTPGAIDNLAATIIETLEDPQTAAMYSEQFQTRIEKEFNVKLMAEKTAAVYDEVL